jgi:antitoxin component HigA of HigAB toxin-antitoxin module
MNKQRREALDKLVMQLESVKEEIDYLRNEEAEAYENLPESFQEGERGQKMQEGIEYIESAMDNIDEAVSNIMEVIGE